jgi:dTDP-glucose 4,6-dehydratase
MLGIYWCTRYPCLPSKGLVCVGCGQADVAQYLEHMTRPGHDLCYSIDPSKLYELGWQEPAAIDQRLAHTIQWYRDNPEWLNR